ncbi:MAG: NAD(P)-binding domain-containing protein [Eubacterium ventriosum]
MDMIGFIGMGNMGTANAKGSKRTFDGSQIIFHRKSVDKMKELAEEEKVNYACLIQKWLKSQST